MARARGFLGPGPVEEHIAHALAFARAWGAPPPAQALDLGSGGGLPGLVLADLWPGTAWVLLDASERRTTFLAEVAPPSVTVRRARAEEAGREPALRGAFELVTARSFGPPPVTAECAAPFLRPGGRLVVSEPPDGADRWPAEGAALVGLVPLRRTVTAVGSFQVLVQERPIDDRFPRRVGLPAKRPLF
ncbi:MAG TPA: RsmG family class I SAM-dependent methyltransferase [Acidimicrobiales bacterium]|nr:RsmG family class I SAM-dependent methyltransferase [Acidimicrobiales bacterium]